MAATAVVGEVRTTRDLFLWCMSVIYLFAFTSLFVQIPGLFGDHGILPAKLVLEKDAESFHDLVVRQPTLLRLLPRIGFDVETGLDFLCLGGAVLSFVAMVSRDQRNCVVFTALWAFYLSVFQVGQAFLWFQWDVLLLEVGFLTILLAPLNFFGLLDATCHHAHDRIVVWLVRWLLFRTTFSSGVDKLTGDDQTSWWSLTAVSQHHETQYLPTPVAWYFHQFPDWLQRLGAVGMLTGQLAVSLFILSPIRHQRILAFYSQVLLMTLLTLTGNYGFYTLLMLTLSLSLVDDDWLDSWTGQTIKAGHPSRRSPVVTGLARWIEPVKTGFSLVSFCAMVFAVARLFSLEVKADPPRVESSISFDADSFELFVRLCVLLAAVGGAGCLCWQIVSTTLWSYRSRRYDASRRRTEVAGCLTIAIFASLIFAISLVPLASINKEAEQRVPESLRQLHAWTEKQYQITSRFLSDVRASDADLEGRSEIVLEGSYDLESGWSEYNFRFKPGNVSHRLPIVSPHQPRLDFQMWFAARHNYQNNYWLLNLVYRLLTQQKEVLELMGNNPFPVRPPKYIRASLYNYHLTSTDKDKDRYSAGSWWVRERVGDYLPVVSLDEPSFADYIEQSGITSQEQDGGRESTTAKTTVGYIRSVLGQGGNGNLVCLLLVVAGFLLTLLDPSIELFSVVPPEEAVVDGSATFDNNCLK